MKKKDLVIGKRYFYSTRQDWHVSTWDTHCVEIVDLEVKKWRWQAGKLVPSGYMIGNTGLRALKINSVSGVVEGEMVVTLAGLRGEWEPTITAVKAAAEKRKKLADEQKAQEDARKNRLGVVLAKARQWLGVSEFNPLIKENYSNKATVVVDVDLFDAMVTELEKQGWTYEKKAS